MSLLFIISIHSTIKQKIFLIISNEAESFSITIDDNYFYLVFEQADTIYYSYSSTLGKSWIKELIIADQGQKTKHRRSKPSAFNRLGKQ